MNIRIVSDLHLEAYIGKSPEWLASTFVPADERDAEAVLVLAGDISSDKVQLTLFIEAVTKRFHRTLFVPGNHEFYRHDYFEWCADMEQRLRQLGSDGVVAALGDVREVTLDGIHFILGTLWGDGGFKLQDRAQVGAGLVDFRLIRYGHNEAHGGIERFTVDRMVQLFKQQRAAIEQALKASTAEKRVVITHHLPSRRLLSPRFWPGDGSDGINGGFVGECDNIICTLEPTLWIHGHTHDTVDTQLWKTRIVANPKGYPREFNHQPQFNNYDLGPVFIGV